MDCSGGKDERRKPREEETAAVQGKSDGSLDYVDGESKKMLRLEGLKVM